MDAQRLQQRINWRLDSCRRNADELLSRASQRGGWAGARMTPDSQSARSGAVPSRARKAPPRWRGPSPLAASPTASPQRPSLDADWLEATAVLLRLAVSLYSLLEGERVDPE